MRINVKDLMKNESISNRMGYCQRLLFGKKSPTCPKGTSSPAAHSANPLRTPCGFLRTFPQTSEALPHLHNRCGKGLVFMEHRQKLGFSEPVTWMTDTKLVRTGLQISAIHEYDRSPLLYCIAADDPAKPRRFSGTSVPESFSF